MSQESRAPMLKITIPGNNIPERKFIIDTLIGEFLGLSYMISSDNSFQSYSIGINENVLEISDCFFGLYPADQSYLKKDALPCKVVFAKNEFTPELDIPIIFGSDEFSISKTRIVCGIDVFASSFFMLSRWEEYVNKTRDEHLRFPGSESVAFKFNFLHRPVVNEYVEFLWRMIRKLGYQGDRKKRSFELILTHDIDQLDFPRIHYILLGDILKRRNLNLARKNFNFYLKTGSNPYDTFDFLMTKSEESGVKSHFYFMSSDLKIHPDNNYYLGSNRFKEKVREIKTRGHQIGFHPGYYTFNDMERWLYEKRLLEEAIQYKIKEGRQHYLRFAIPDTFRIWEECNMEIDSTMGYASNEGFRCGTGDLYNIFDFLCRTQLKLRERPLIVMDGTLKNYSIEQAVTTIKEYILKSKRYNSKITLLFHNTTFYGEEWKGYDALYEMALS